MKKIAFITRHSVANYGSLLQAYGLQKILLNLGYEVVCIDYTNEDEQPNNIAKAFLKDSKWNKSFMKRNFYKLVQVPIKRNMFLKFKEFRKAMLIESSNEYISLSDLRMNFPKADVYCTGSDQVWNYIHGKEIDEAYFLSFLPDDKKRISYASSFGGDAVLKTHKDKIRQLLSKYDSISVREITGINFLNEIDIHGSLVLDPTLLLDKDEWNELTTFVNKPEKYVLVYQLQPNKRFNEYAKKFARLKKLPLIRISPSIHHIFRSGKFIHMPEVGEFLSYIKDATYFLTDSFHGTAFAINFNVQFIDILPGDNNGRNLSILQITNLNDRILKDYSDFNIFDKQINYDNVNRIIKKMRNESINYLVDSID